MRSEQRYALTGILRRHRTGYGYTLELPDGGGWSVDTAGSAEQLIGRKVHIEARRVDFEWLSVARIWPVGEPRPLTLRERVLAWLGRGRA